MTKAVKKIKNEISKEATFFKNQNQYINNYTLDSNEPTGSNKRSLQATNYLIMF